MENVFGANRKPSSACECAVSSFLMLIDTAFAQQKLRAWQPVLTPLPVIISFLVIGIVFIPVGVILLETSNQVQEVESDAYQSCSALSQSCTLTFSDLDMQPPIYIYYKLENFYQNHRRYVKSRNDNQLRGAEVTEYADLNDCRPYASANDSTNAANFYLPCGLIARSVFNDTFTLSDADGTDVTLSNKGVAWDSDVDAKFNNPPADTPGIRVIPDFEDPDFIVWMRTAGLPTFRKLWRIVKTPLKGDYTITMRNNFPVESFGGKKYVILSTTSWLGGKNPFLGSAYIAVGCLCVLLAAIFAIKHRVSGRSPGDTSYLEWAR